MCSPYKNFISVNKESIQLFEGFQFAQEALKTPHLNPSGSTHPHNPSTSQGNSEMDGNCLGTSSGGSSMLPTPYSRSNRRTKQFANQDYDELKKRYKSRGQLFEDPEFPPSNRLLVDDKNQYIISYFGRTRLDGSSIEWLRPHVSIF